MLPQVAFYYSAASGRLEVHECTGGGGCTFTVEPGCYRVRALFEQLNSLDESGLEDSDSNWVDLWPAPSKPLEIIKQWSGSNAG